ncbi:MAG TPA: hypothetical protein VFU30_04920 [Gaiellaceae bacterium]|nr:hypothetical protein [Gaiellaceae bacterium]
MSENGKQPTRRTGATLFSELVRAHYRREAEAENGVVGGGKAQADFEAKLTEFEHEVGQIDSVYWSSRRPSAVALTIGEPHGVKNPFKDTETEVRLHRVTDWVTGDRSEIADLLHDCDLLAIRVGEVLRGASERITMRWIFSVQEHLLGFFERTDPTAPRLRRWVLNGKRDMDRAELRLVLAQRQELARIEEYYLRIAGKAGRIVYVSGMIAGAVFIALVCALIAVGLAVWYPEGWTANERYLLLCAGAGAAGALTSVLARMNSIGGSFTIDVELGRPLLRRLGLYKPFVGAIFGVAVYWIVTAGLLTTKLPKEAHNGRIFFFGIIAFLAGFSERFTGVIFGGAERLISGDPGDTGASDARGQVDAKTTTPAVPPPEARAPKPPAPARPES